MRLLEKIKSLWRGSAVDAQSREALMAAFQDKYANFQTLLASNTELLEIIADIERKLDGQTVFGPSYIDAQSMRCIFHTARMVRCLEQMGGRPYPVLEKKLTDIFSRIKAETVARPVKTHEDEPFVLPYAALGQSAVDMVGGKNAHIAEIMNALDIPTPRGFAITTAAFRHFIQANDLTPIIQKMKRKADLIETETILEISQAIQSRIMAAEVPPDLAQAILDAYERLWTEIGDPGGTPVNVALRSSALGEDSTLSFAGQYLTVLNVPRERILTEYRRVIASLFSAQAIAYRLHMAITFEDAVMAVACQETIEAEASGVMFTHSPVNPMEDRILIDAVWGLGPFAVDGIVPPDTYELIKRRIFG
ncbi:PEP/pyruvate-binding domain-containing protein [Desulfosarcina cetonica]|uniref:PEP/pyruvate-binding domain-containing protein n=1 Tax=Desulfosarcina cetonica TaxID=90730 RepID=UPI0006D1174A|nr:PEP/pyruvate-binding domain-containing protein [Desulfosarcina cetonica]